VPVGEYHDRESSDGAGSMGAHGLCRTRCKPSIETQIISHKDAKVQALASLREISLLGQGASPRAVGTTIAVNDYRWKLYELTQDFSEASNFAAKEAKKHRELQAQSGLITWAIAKPLTIHPWGGACLGEHHRRPGVGGDLEGSRLRPIPTGFLLRPSDRDSNAALDGVRRLALRDQDGCKSSHEGPATRLHLADLVHSGEIRMLAAGDGSGCDWPAYVYPLERAKP
jgi:hypothetical protein